MEFLPPKKLNVNNALDTREALLDSNYESELKLQSFVRIVSMY